jgi:hypothetical protein
VATARTLEKEIAETPQDFDAATRDAVRRLALDLATSEGANPKDVKALMTLVLKTRDQDLAERGLQLKVREFEERFTAARQALDKMKERGGLDPATLADLEKQLRML